MRTSDPCTRAFFSPALLRFNGRFWLTSALENVGLKSTASSTSIFSTSPVASSTMKA